MISPRWHKVLKDLWGNKARTLLAVMAIAAGVFGVGMISTAYFTLDNDVEITYAAVHPAYGVLTTGPFDEELVKVAGRLSRIEEAEGRVVLGGMNILLGSGKKHPLSMTAVKDLSKLRMDQLRLLSGHWPGKLEMLVITNRFAQVGD
jgi:putative ABC transport system permease protein